MDNKFLFSLEKHRLNVKKWFPTMHSHHLLEISFVQSGFGYYTIDDRVYDVQPGDIFLLNNIERHALYVTSQEDIIHMVIHFEPNFIWSVESNYFDSSFLRIFFNRNGRFQNRMERENPIVEKLKRSFFEIENEMLQKQSDYDLMAKVHLLHILVNIGRHFGYVNDDSAKGTTSKKDVHVINKVMEYINEHYHEDIHMSDLSKIVYLNPAYISVLFKRLNGISPWEYISRKRVYRAIEYLTASDKGILEIAGLCGFNNAANFNKIFKKVVGATPSSYR